MVVVLASVQSTDATRFMEMEWVLTSLNAQPLLESTMITSEDGTVKKRALQLYLALTRK